MMNLYLISAESTLRPDWAEYAKAPTAPSNYKDPEKIQAYIESKRAGLEQEIEKNTRLVDFHKIRMAHYCCGWRTDKSEEEDVFCQFHCDVYEHQGPVMVVGDRVRTILNWICRDPEVYKNVFGNRGDILREMFFWEVNYFLNRVVTLEELLFNAKERDLLLTDKLIPVKRGDYRDEINYMRAAIVKLLGFDPEGFQSTTYDVVTGKKYGNMERYGNS